MIYEDVKIEMTLEELKLHKEKYEKESQASLENIIKLNDVLMKKLELGPSFPQVNEKTKKLQELFAKLSALIDEKQEVSKETEAKYKSLRLLYLEHKQVIYEIDNKPATPDADTSPASKLSERELSEIQADRDKALGLAKVLLATLKSSRIQSEENFNKLKYSADLMFHILYKAEDAFLGGTDTTE